MADFCASNSRRCCSEALTKPVGIVVFRIENAPGCCIVVLAHEKRGKLVAALFRFVAAA
jgi:hypothetical protein